MFECNISSFNETLPRLGGLLSRLELLIFQANKNIVKKKTEDPPDSFLKRSKNYKVTKLSIFG